MNSPKKVIGHISHPTVLLNIMFLVLTFNKTYRAHNKNVLMSNYIFIEGKQNNMTAVNHSTNFDFAIVALH